MCGERGRAHLGSGARGGGGTVAAVVDHRGGDEVFVEVVDVFDHASFPGAGDGDEVEHRQVLDGLAQAHAPGVRADGDAELRGEQQMGDVLVDAADAGRVDLEDLHGSGLEELLDHDAVVHVFAGGHRDGGDGAGDGGVAQDVVGAGGFLHPGRVIGREGADPLDGGGHVPALVGVDRDGVAGAADLAGEPQTSDVVVEVGADLQFDLRESGVEGLAAQTGEFSVGVAEPAGAGRVGGVSVGQEVLFAYGPAGFGAAQEGEGLVAGEGVGEVAVVDEVGDPLGGHPGQQLPERQSGPLGPEVPQGVEDRADGHVHDALLGAQPAQLGVVGQDPPCLAHVVEERFHLTSDEVALQHLDGGHLDVVAAADGEGEGVSLVAVGRVGAEDDVGGRVVGVRVHGVGAVERRGGREADVRRGDGGDRGHGPSRDASKHRINPGVNW